MSFEQLLYDFSSPGVILCRSLSQQPVQLLSVNSQDAICGNTPGLTGQQRRFCRLHPDIMMSVAHGARLAVSECRRQFHNSRWNCSSFPGDPSVFGDGIVQGQREL